MIKPAERKRQAENSTHIREIEIIDNRKVPTSFKIYLENSNNKTSLAQYLFQKWRETLLYLLTSSQSIYLVNLDGTKDRVTSQSSKKIDFYCNHEETKTFCVYQIPL